MPALKPKNDAAWEALFAERSIVKDVDKHGLHRISAAAINTKREARLMTKFDHRVNLPAIFTDNGLAILPDSRSSYVIGRLDCYAEIPLPDDSEPIERNFPTWMQSLSADNLYSESAVILCAQHAGLLADLLDEECFLTVFGRMSTGAFDFSIRSFGPSNGPDMSRNLSVDRAQCEIDGGFEGATCFAIVEVKNEAVSDFHIRQIYYPYRLWKSKVTKPVIPIFLTYSNEIFTFHVYEFADPNDYNSLQIVKRRRYQIVPTEIDIAAVRHILTTGRVTPEPNGVPFPQADNFERVIDLLTRLQAAGGTLTQEEITTNYAFDLRQTQYYTNAGRYLGLIEWRRDAERGVHYTLTQRGSEIMNKAPRLRNLAITELILSQRVFREAVELYLANAQAPDSAAVVALMERAGLGLNATTSDRRAQTVLGWVRWIIGLTAAG